MIVSQNMMAEAEIICKQSLPMLDVKYHLCVATTTQDHNLPVDVAASHSSPIFGEPRVSEPVSNDFPHSDSVGQPISLCLVFLNEVISLGLYELFLNSDFDIWVFLGFLDSYKWTLRKP
jgi:hypothetical protein